MHKSPPAGKYAPPVPRHVFEDTSGRRIRFLAVVGALLVLVITGFSAEFFFRVYNLKPPLQTSAVFDAASRSETRVVPGADIVTVVMKESAYTDCRQGLFTFGKSRSGIAGYVPFDDPTALSGLRARCRDLETVYYQAFSFGAVDGRVEALGSAGAGFPLPEFNTGYLARNRPIAFPVLTPIIGTLQEALADLFASAGEESPFMARLRSLDLRGVDGGVCIDMGGYPDMEAGVLVTLFESLNSWLAPKELRSCLIGNMDAGFWRDTRLSALVGQPLLLGFRPSSGPSVPVAAQGWFDTAAVQAQKRMPVERLSVALGSFSTLWKSGARAPERLPFAEAMLRIGFFDGAVNFAPETGNTNARFLDDERRLNQIWVLDAASFHNQRLALGKDVQITVWPLGYEDSAVWDIAQVNDPEDGVGPLIEAGIDLSDQVSVEGAGPFSTHIAYAVAGTREVEVSPESGRIISQTYTKIPGPRRIRLFGESYPFDLSLAFNGVGSEAETDTLLALLEKYGLNATFFLSTGDLLLSESSVAKLLAAGQTVGTAMAPRESRFGFARFLSTLQNNMAQQLLQDRFDRLALLVRNPSRYGQFPGDKAVLDQLQDLQAAGYLPVYSTLAAPNGTFSPSDFVAGVRNAAFDTPANVLSFDFSEQNDGVLNRLLPEILQQLLDDGFTFVSLPKIAGLEPVQVLPAAVQEPAGRDQIIYSLMKITWSGAQSTIFLLALLVLLRAPIVLILAFIRRGKHPFDADFHPPVTIIIPAYNEGRVIRKTLESVAASDYQDLEIIVVDDGSTDDTAAVVEDFAKDAGRRVLLIRQENHGKWHATDHALYHVDSEIFVIVDADTLLRSDAVKYLVQPFRDEVVGAVAGTVEIGNRDNILTSCQVIEYKISQDIMRRAYEVFDGILVVPGAIGAWRKEAVVKSGLVSGDTITEDADLTVALHRSGFKVRYEPQAKSFTEAPNSVRALMRQRLRWALGMLQVAWKHRRSVIEGHPVGLISILDAIWLLFVASIIYPLVDIISLILLASWSYAIISHGSITISDQSIGVIRLFLLLTFLDIINLFAAFWFERKFEWKLLVLVPFLRFGYRQILYISSMRSIFHALTGRLRGWQKLERTDTAKMPIQQRLGDFP